MTTSPRAGSTPAASVRIAMWSGPRNISTALMRSWESRGDTAVWDEPLYAHYLKETVADHPGREEVIRRHEPDWRKVVQRLTGPVPDGKPIFYQKHMAHHLLPDVDRAWLDEVRNAFLIRDPREMLTSLVRVTPEPTVEDTGLPQQWEIFERIAARRGAPPPVVDARDILEEPEKLLSRLCESLGVPFKGAMLSWKPGPRASDGIWAKHWYSTVEASRGFRPYVPRMDAVPERLAGVHAECEAIYRRLHERRLTAER
ncbi:MAG TPA: HAD family hydrolase [Gemmatimonadota bacterium]|nr:HAD family hydrolase [Gemmatimonadota bacterium]